VAFEVVMYFTAVQSIEDVASKADLLGLESTATTSFGSSLPGSRLCIIVAAVFCRMWRCSCGFLIRLEFVLLSRPAKIKTRT
jgi:hypothetical protein